MSSDIIDVPPPPEPPEVDELNPDDKREAIFRVIQELISAFDSVGIDELVVLGRTREEHGIFMVAGVESPYPIYGFAMARLQELVDSFETEEVDEDTDDE